MKTLLLIIIGAIMINFCLNVTQLIFYLEPGEETCLHEYYSDKTLIIAEANFNVTEGGVRIRDPDEKVLVSKVNVREHKEGFTTFNGGYYEFCIANKNREEIAEVNFSLKHGVAAKDYSTVAKAKDLKPMELDVRWKFKNLIKISFFKIFC